MCACSKTQAAGRPTTARPPLSAEPPTPAAAPGRPTRRYWPGPSRFPPPQGASPEGVVAVGAAPVPELLKDAYLHGVFPWPHDGLPLLWFSPDPRFVLVPETVRLPRSLKKAMRKSALSIRCDTAFSEVMAGCSTVHRPGQGGTWITDEMIAGYVALHEEGVAHSIEAWDGDTLVGGLYGLSFGDAFFGESMFAHAPDASKVAFATLLAQLFTWGVHLVDCQVYTDHLARFGAEEWSRNDYLDALAVALDAPTRLGPWRMELSPADAVQALADPAAFDAADSDADRHANSDADGQGDGESGGDSNPNGTSE